MTDVALPVWASKLFDTTRHNARKRGIQFDLTHEHMAKMIQRARGSCEVTGLPFVVAFSKQPGGARRYSRRPWAPSIDRIDNALGYDWPNVRLVCCMANVAMNEWGEDALKILGRAIIKKYSTWEPKDWQETFRRIFAKFSQ